MSRIKQIMHRCPVCGKTERFPVLLSTNAFGSMDLDMRPPQMQRGTMFCWVQECPHCGYVARNLEKIPDHLDQNRLIGIIGSEAYRDCDGLPLFRVNGAAKFYHFYQLAKERNDAQDCFFGLKCCAWYCDDAGAVDVARVLRRMAITYLKDIAENNPDEKETAMLLLVEYSRRSGDFQQALAYLNEYEDSFTDIMSTIAKFERVLAERQDDARYTVADACNKKED